VLEALCDGAQATNGFRRDLGTDAVAG